ncbi:MAG TPA: tetratricopeptide repeat protein [Thermoanaerobaculia bacterium]|nr:tetratricopeptide repeat protein [Thermoanaerobaculia bacterium]
MKGRTLVIVLAGLLSGALLWQGRRWHDHMLGSAYLRQVELVSMSIETSGRTPPRNILPAHLELLRRAAQLDPAEIGIPLARGSQFLLFGSPSSAIPAYREAEALEPRPEIYLNLGRAYLAAGDAEAARRNFALAVRLDPNLIGQVPPGAL